MYIIERNGQYLENWTYAKKATELYSTLWTTSKIQGCYFSDYDAAQSFVDKYQLKDVTIVKAP